MLRIPGFVGLASSVVRARWCHLPGGGRSERVRGARGRRGYAVLERGVPAAPLVFEDEGSRRANSMNGLKAIQARDSLWDSFSRRSAT
jgi:hypothetical protein